MKNKKITQQIKTILTKEGYLLKKDSFKSDELEKIRKELTVEPQISYSVGIKNKIEKFSVYKENDEYLSIPKFYGINRLGKPELNEEILGDSVDFNFNGDLRPLQKDIVSSVMNHLNKNDGGGICVGCGVGKTVMGINIANKVKKKL